MREADHFGLWAMSLALRPEWLVVYRAHDGFCRRLAWGDRVAQEWAEGGRAYLAAELAKYEGDLPQ